MSGRLCFCKLAGMTIEGIQAKIVERLGVLMRVVPAPPRLQGCRTEDVRHAAEKIYLDNNATTRADPGVVAEMLPYFSEFFGNASSQHGYGAPVAAAVRGRAKPCRISLVPRRNRRSSLPRVGRKWILRDLLGA